MKSNRPTIRTYSERAKQNFLRDLQAVNWDQLYSHSDVNTAYDFYYETITKAYNRNFPLVKLSRQRAKDKPWITTGLKKSSRHKNKLYKQWLKTGTKQAAVKYKTYKQKFTALARECEMTYYREMFDKTTDTMKQLWKNLKSVCSFSSKKQQTQPVTKITISSQDITNSAEIANAFNDYFCSIGENLSKQLTDPSDKSACFQHYLDKSQLNSMFCSPVEIDELTNLFRKLDDKKSSGPDNIGPKLLKLAAPFVANPLLYIFNLSFSAGTVPDKMKTAKVIPLYKKGQKNLMQNYRPISLLDTAHKLLEKLMNRRLLQFLEHHNIIYNCQFGFRKHHSTTSALIEVIDNIYRQLDNKEFVLGTYLDLQKAFDTVNHKILLAKLYNYGIRGPIYKWFESYLSNRKQYTVVNGICSSTHAIEYGVPQGSVLGPVLFLLYINDIKNAAPINTVKLFADDTNLFVNGKSETDVCEKANEILKNLANYFLANKLTVSIDKTCYSIFSPFPRSNCNSNHVAVKFAGTPLTRVDYCKYLGLYIDNKMTWEYHIESVYKKLIRLVGIFYKLRSKLPDYCLKSIYFAFVYPHLLYGIELYANTVQSRLDPLEKLNNKILRILQNKPLLTHTSVLYSNYTTLPIRQLFSYQILLLVHKVLHQGPAELPHSFLNYFNPNSNIHPYYTRACNSPHLERVNTSFGSRSIQFKGSQLWSRIPTYLQTLTSYNSFRAQLRTFLVFL